MTDQTPAPPPAPLFEEDCEFWMVWNKNGPPRVTHHTEEEAMRVAAIMARRHPGRTFIVMKGYHKFNTKEFVPWPRPVLQEEDITTDEIKALVENDMTAEPQ